MTTGTISSLIHEDIPRYDFWLKTILVGVVALTLVTGLFLLFVDFTTAMVMFGVTIFDALLFQAILPHRFQIYNDHLKIMLGRPFSIDIPFSNIETIRLASGHRAFSYWGIRFATSTHGVIEIVRKKGLSMVISPSNPETFVEQFHQVISQTHA